MSTSPTITTFRDMRVWQAGMQLAEEVYRLTQSFPAEEAGELVALMRQAAVSILCHVAEGQRRLSQSREENVRCLSLAYGAVAALETQIELAGRLGYLSTDEVTRTLDHAVSISKQLYNLRGALAKKVSGSSPASGPKAALVSVEGPDDHAAAQ
jgi:four helix bundle protein